MDRALRWIGVLGGLLREVANMVRRGEADRLDEILPDEYLTDLELRRAELEALARFAHGEVEA